MKRILIALAVAAGLAAAAYGAAASLGNISGGTLAAGNATISGCSTPTLSYITSEQDNNGGPHFEVVGVKVQFPNTACDGNYVLIDPIHAGNSDGFASSGLDNCHGFTPLGGTTGQIGHAQASVDGQYDGSASPGLAVVSLNGCGIPVADLDGVAVMVKPTAN